MTCPQLASTSEVKLYYAVDADPSSAVPADQEWEVLRATGESFDASLSSTISDEMTDTRSYAGSALTQGEIIGGSNYEMSLLEFERFMIAVLQDDNPIGAWEAEATVSAGDVIISTLNPGNVYFECTVGGDTDTTEPAAWDYTPGQTTTDATVTWTARKGSIDDAQVITNGTTKSCLMFLRVVPRTGGTDYYTFRGCQIDTLSLSMQPGALITGAIGVQGTGIDKAITPGASWVYRAAAGSELLSSVDALKSLDLKVAGGASLNVTFQNLEITISNQLRQQQGVGTGSIYASGVASGRIQVTMSTTQYYADGSVFDNFVANTDLELSFDLEESGGSKYAYLFGKVKVTSGGVPMAGGPDQDLLISPAMQAFEHATDGTVKITKTIV